VTVTSPSAELSCETCTESRVALSWPAQSSAAAVVADSNKAVSPATNNADRTSMQKDGSLL
jgi:hypothetical protein